LLDCMAKCNLLMKLRGHGPGGRGHRG
jgi:hypothetical protein